MAKETYSFTLILAGASEVTPAIADALYGAGCDDATLASRDGVVFADFDREAASLDVAITSAIADVEKAGLGLKVTRVEPDEWVTIAEIAHRIGQSRESVRLYATGRRGPGGFPPPVAKLKGRSPLWRWADVASWFAERQSAHAPGPSPTLPDTRLIGAINATLELRRHLPTVQATPSIRRLIGLAAPKGKPVRSRKKQGVGA